MKKRLITYFVLILIVSCKEINSECIDNLSGNGYDLEELRTVLLDFHKLDSLENLMDREFNEVYRLTWSNGWTETVFFTIGKKRRKYQIFVEGYSSKNKKYVRKVIELERYEWTAITEELDRTNFWCSRYYSGNTNRGIIDGATYYLEGIKDDKYHGITWQVDKTRDRLLNRILKSARLLDLKTTIQLHPSKDSLVYEFGITPSVNTKESWLITDKDTIKKKRGQLISIKLDKLDTTVIWGWKMIQMTYDNRINEIPLADMEVKLSRN